MLQNFIEKHTFDPFSILFLIKCELWYLSLVTGSHGNACSRFQPMSLLNPRACGTFFLLFRFSFPFKWMLLLSSLKELIINLSVYHSLLQSVSSNCFWISWCCILCLYAIIIMMTTVVHLSLISNCKINSRHWLFYPTIWRFKSISASHFLMFFQESSLTVCCFDLCWYCRLQDFASSGMKPQIIAAYLMLSQVFQLYSVVICYEALW